MSDLEIVIGASNQSTLEAMRRMSFGSHIKIVLAERGPVGLHYPVDAEFLSAGMAEHLGSRPLPPYTAEILPASQEMLEDGWPNLIITGVTVPASSADEASQVKAIMAAINRCVESYQREEGTEIKRVGIRDDYLYLDKLPLGAIAAAIIQSSDTT